MQDGGSHPAHPRIGADRMIGIGCLAPVVLFVCGALAGHFILGSAGVPWGAGIGFVAGLALLGLVGWVVGRTKDR